MANKNFTAALRDISKRGGKSARRLLSEISAIIDL
jgi:hypothetical protein